MKQATLFLLLFVFTFYINAQEITTLNLGETRQKNYYTVIPYETISGVPIIRVQIDGSEYRFMFDTGAVTSISQEIVDKIKPETLLEKLSVTDNSAKVDSLPVYSLSEIMVGVVQFNDIPALLFNESTVKTCLEIDGIVGSNLLRNSIVRFSTSDQTITITDRPENFDLQSKEEYSTEMVLTPNQSSPYIWTALRDKDTAGVELMFDSGMVGLYDLALDHLNLFMEHDIFSEKPSVAEGSLSYGFFGKNDDTLQCRLRVPELNICNSIFKNVMLYTTPASDSRIGMGLLDHGTVTIDYMNKRFYFEPSF
ncbi:MAG: retropepsin-like aspartic protease [Dysgonomonas sp.]